MQRRVLSQQSLWDNQWRHWPQWRRGPGQSWHSYKVQGCLVWYAMEDGARFHIEARERKARNGST